jgi:hypothetical protein
MKRWYVTLALVGVCACARPEAVPTTLSQNVPTAVAVSCLKPGQRPVRPAKLVEDLPVAPETLTEMVGRFRAKLREWSGYGETADSLMKACETVPPAGATR